MSTKLLKAISLFLSLAIILAFIPVSAASPTTAYYGREKLAAMDYGSYLVGAYDAICEGVANKSSKVSVGNYNINVTQMEMIITIYSYDHPEHYWLANGYSYGTYVGTGIVSSIYFNYLSGFDDAAFSAEVNKLLKVTEGKTSEYEKALALHDALIRHVEYKTTENAHNAYGAIVEGKAVCEGYAEAYQYLLQCVGIQAFSVVGSSRDLPHEWTLVRIDGKYFYTDVTWDDPSVDGVQENSKPIFHSYFNIGTSELEKDHIIDDEFGILPDCSPTNPCDKHTQISDYTVSSVIDAFKYDDGQWIADIYFIGEEDNFESWWLDNYISVLTRLNAWGSVNWISDSREHYIVVTPEPNISSANLNITAPVGYAHPNSTVVSSNANKYIGFVSWYDGETKLTESDKFQVGKTYTARVEFDALFGYKFNAETVFTVNGNSTYCYGEIFEREIKFTVTSILGDIYYDGSLNSLDLIEFKKQLLNDSQSEQLDLNSDGNVNLLDFVRLKKLLSSEEA